MPRKRDFFHTGLNVSRSDLAGLPFGANQTGAQDYFVDGNIKVSDNGEHWDSPTKSLSEAIAMSNISIKLSTNRWWARRNRIFCCGDQELDEDLTVMPEKCDIIGVGFDLVPFPRMIGSHIITTSSAVGKAYGTRIFNMGFINDTANETFKFNTGHIAVEFWGCSFWPRPAGSTICISLVDSNRSFRFMSNKIFQDASIGGLFAEGIKISGTSQPEIEIDGNYIYATEGIHAGTTLGANNGVINNNTIRATVLTINDESDEFIVTNNLLISEADPTGNGSGMIVSNHLLSLNNRLMSDAGTERNAEYPLPVPLS